MTDLAAQASGIEALISRLAAEARPVRPLRRPWVRAALWLGAALWVGLLLSYFTDFAALRARLMGAPDMWLSEAGAAATAILAALAAFETSVPGRSRLWAVLPLPAAALWVGASGLGCLRYAGIAGTEPEPAMHGMVCLSFLLLVSLPLAGLLVVLLQRACPLRPGLTGLLGGLASAGAASVLLSMIHPFDATAEDLAMHLVAVVAIVLLTGSLGTR
jgi:hypothetical protein